jgi:hypothetical protein
MLRPRRGAIRPREIILLSFGMHQVWHHEKRENGKKIIENLSGLGVINEFYSRREYFCLFAVGERNISTAKNAGISRHCVWSQEYESSVIFRYLTGLHDYPFRPRKFLLPLAMKGTECFYCGNRPAMCSSCLKKLGWLGVFVFLYFYVIVIIWTFYSFTAAGLL